MNTFQIKLEVGRIWGKRRITRMNVGVAAEIADLKKYIIR